MINEYTFSPIHQILGFGDKACINGVIVNPNNYPLTIQFIDWNFLANQITIPPNSKLKFKDMKVRQIKLISGQGIILYSPDNQDVDMGLENVTVQNINQDQTYFINFKQTSTFNGADIVPPVMLGFLITLPPNTGIKIKNFTIQASPTFSPSLIKAKTSTTFGYTFATYIVTYNGNASSFLLNSLFQNTKLCSQLKGSNNYIFIENSNMVIYLTSYSSTSILCGNSSSKKILYLSDNLNYSTFNFGNTTISFIIAYEDNISGKYTFTGNWYLSMLVEPIPSSQVPNITPYKFIEMAKTIQTIPMS